MGGEVFLFCRLGSYFLEVSCMINCSFSGVGCPIDKRQKSIANRGAAWTTRRFLARLLFTKPDAKRRTGGYCGCQIIRRQTISTSVKRTIPIPQRLIEPSLPRPSL